MIAYFLGGAMDGHEQTVPEQPIERFLRITDHCGQEHEYEWFGCDSSRKPEVAARYIYNRTLNSASGPQVSIRPPKRRGHRS